MGELLTSWQKLVTQRGGEVALILAESDERYTFLDLERAADALLSEYPELAQASACIWAYAAANAKDWLAIYLAALRVGAIAMPVEEVGSGDVNREQLLELGVAFCLTQQGLERLPTERNSRQGHLIKLTSGTTGRPKALLFSEAEMAADGRQIMQSMQISGSDCNYGVIPLGHSYGLGNLLMPLLLEGTQLVMASAPYPQVIAEEVQRYQCTILPAVPPLIKALARAELQPTDLQSLRLVISAGSALAPEVAAQFLAKNRCRVHNFYGSSETGGICFDRSGDYTLSGEAVGEPLQGVQLQVAANGELYVQSAAVCRSAHGEQGCLVNDSGALDASGALRLLGRHSDFVKLAGKRLFLSEVEQSLCRLSEVMDAYVTHRPGRSGEPRLIAMVQSELSSDAIREALRRGLPEWKLPKRFYSLSTMPYTERGKKDRAALELLVDQALA